MAKAKGLPVNLGGELHTQKKPPSAQEIELPALERRHLTVTIIGDTPLIVHKFSEKAKAEMLAKQTKKARTAKAAKVPWKDFCGALYWLDGMPDDPTEKDVQKARFGFPSIGLKAACVTACTSISGITKVAARQQFHIDDTFIEIQGSAPIMREDMVRIQMTSDIRHRPEFWPWYAEVTFTYNGNAISQEQILNLVNTAGFGVGLGEWRPERDGNYGRFHCATADELKQFSKEAA